MPYSTQCHSQAVAVVVVVLVDSQCQTAAGGGVVVLGGWCCKTLLVAGDSYLLQGSAADTVDARHLELLHY